MSRSKCDNCPRVRALEAEVAALRRKVDELMRAGKRQAAPFSKGEPKPDPKRPGRKPGKDYGRRAHRPRPRRVDEDYDVPLPPACTHPGCGGRKITGPWPTGQAHRGSAALDCGGALRQLSGGGCDARRAPAGQAGGAS